MRQLKLSGNRGIRRGQTEKRARRVPDGRLQNSESDKEDGKVDGEEAERGSCKHAFY